MKDAQNNTLKELLELNQYLLTEMPEYKNQSLLFEKNEQEQWGLFRSLVNVRPPLSASKEFLDTQNKLLKSMIKKKGITCVENLVPIIPGIYIWQGDITTLKADAVVNAANSALLGCFIPCHNCIDNAIHTYAGVQLRLECQNIMEKQGAPEPTGKAQITKGYNLPAKYVIHTVGPIIHGILTNKDCDLLASCYRSCLETADLYQLKSIAFCCISTGEFHFPNDIVAQIAVKTVRQYLKETNSGIKVIFNVFKDKDFEIYRELLESIKKIEP